MVCGLIMSNQLTGFTSETLYRVANYVRDNYGPINITCDDYDELYELMLHDKKNLGDTINFTLMKATGNVELNHTASKEEIGSVLDIFRDLMGI